MGMGGWGENSNTGFCMAEGVEGFGKKLDNVGGWPYEL